jgi:NADH:ubiquinone oxidoreductase subunit 6 (subunit J)
MPLTHTKDPHRVRLPLLQYLDVALVLLAMAPALALGAPVLGYAVAAGGWIVQRVVAETDRRWIRKVAEPRKQLGVSLFEAFGRIWLLAGVIIIAGVVGGQRDGLTAALVIFGAYTVAFAIRVITGPPPRRAVQ